MSPRRTIPQEKKQGRLPAWLIIGGLTALIVLIVLVAADFWAKSQPAAVPASSGTALNGMPANGRTLGDPKAPIAMVEFSDFQ